MANFLLAVLIFACFFAFLFAGLWVGYDRRFLRYRFR